MSAPLSLPGLTQFLSRLEDYPRLLEAVDQGKQTIALSGLSAVHRAYLAAALHQSTGRPLTLVCPDDGEARRLAGDLSALTGAEVPVLPARDFLFHPGAASRQWEHQRLEILARLHRGDCPVLVATVEGLLQRTMPPRSSPPAAASSMWARSVSRRGSPTFWFGRGTPGATRWRGQGSSPCGGAFWTSSPPAWTCRCGWNFGGMRSTPWACLTR